ncbi:hypothetical protein CJ030_MR5G020292 [Morella rubra]|uniref:Uncharacterized protein n=1 Tax=Morella rubra TaxID=262757 RepID=A0A6A1VL61_9ROSI|nr:hypothetical protein CJ030_MR5G020310 [Morella rubra]KAB1213639.1 hypothetical protein CJ030_MR5G020292 [Morella rubra]
MWNNDKILPAKGFSTPPPARNPRPRMPMSERKRSSPANNGDLYHVIYKVPAGDSPYVRAKHVQLIDKDPSRAISLFWAAINAGDRVDSALKDMSIVMKQLDRSDEAIEAIKSFRHLCPYDSQESLDNVLVELYKMFTLEISNVPRGLRPPTLANTLFPLEHAGRDLSIVLLKNYPKIIVKMMKDKEMRSGRIEEEIQMLQLKLKRIEECMGFGGRRTKTARSQGKKVQITVEQEISRILGNLAWAYLQQSNYKACEEHYRSGRIEEEIQMLQLKLKRIEECMGFGGRRTKTARSQGKKVQITVEQEISRILGNLAWAYLQQSNYKACEEHYRKALSLEPDRNKQCNLAICLMHMNRIAEAKSLLQAVRSSSGNRAMDESYAKSYERAFQMLTDAESQSLLNLIEQKGGNQNEVQRSSTSLVNRNPKEIGSFASGGQHYGSAFMAKRWADGQDDETVVLNEHGRGSYHQNQIERKDSCSWCDDGTTQAISFEPRGSLQSSPQTISVHKWKKGPHMENWRERMSGFSTRMNENCVGSTGTEATPTFKNIYPSPTTAGRNSYALYTQPRRSSWGIKNEYQRRKTLGDDAVRSSSRKLLFEPPRATENLQAESIPDVKEDLLASPSPSPSPSSDTGDWRKSSRDLARVRDASVINPNSQSTLTVDRKSIDGYARMKSAISLKELVEPSMVADNDRTLESAIDRERDDRSGTTLPGTVKRMNSPEETTLPGTVKRMNSPEESVRNNISGASDALHQTSTEIPPSANDNHKKSWADMVEEEEQELLSGSTLAEYYDGWNDENLSSNIISQTPNPQNQIKNLSYKFESFDLKDRYGTSGASFSSRNLAVQRSLSFDQHDKPESRDYFYSSHLPKKCFSFEGCNSVNAQGRDSVVSEENKTLMRRNRLQVFREITLHPESPGSLHKNQF